MHTTLSLRVAALIVVATPCAAFAQSASTNVTVFRVGLPTLNFPGVGSNTFNFASGGYTQGSGTSTGSASAGRGKISAFAASGDFGGSAGSLGSMGCHASASLSDSFTISADTDAPLNFEFGLRASGNVNTVRAGTTSVSGTPSASVEWSISMNGGPSSRSASGAISESYTLELINGVLVRTLVRTETGLGFNEFALVAEVGNGRVGQAFSISMSALSRAGYNAGPQGSTMSGVADFGNTLRWRGLRSVTFADGTPYTGPIQITSASGFNYQFASCEADFNADGFVDFFDFDAFVGCFEGGECPLGQSADFNADGFVDFFDFQDFVDAFDAGC